MVALVSFFVFSYFSLVLRAGLSAGKRKKPVRHCFLFYLEVEFSIFRHTGATNCTDEDEIGNTKLHPRRHKRIRRSNNNKLECGPMPNVMVALPNTGGAFCSTPQSLADAHY